MKAPLSGMRSPVGGDNPVVFPKSTAVQVLAATRYVNGLSRNQPPRRRDGAPGGGGGGVFFAKVTGATIASGNSGTVTLYDASGASLSSRTETAFLFLSGSVATGTNVYIAMSQGKWHVISADC